MALNLWKIGGLTTTLNPLPTSLVPVGGGNGANGVPIGVGDYTISFIASTSVVNGGRIQVVDSGGQGISQYIVPTTTPTFYTFTFSRKSLTGGNALYISDSDNVGTIKVTDIMFTHKALPKLTINGLDGFNSGKWVPSSNSTMTVNDDSSVTMNATASWASVSLSFIPVLPNTQYDLTVLCSGGGIRADEYASDKTTNTAQNNGDYTQSSITFTTQSNTYYLIIYLGNGALGSGSFTFKQPMLNLGTTPAPYSPKTGDKMVMPTPKKNLFNINGNINTGVTGVTATYQNTQDGVSVSTFNGNSDTNAIGQMVTLVVGQTYTLSAISQMCGDNTPSRLRVKSYDGTVTPVTLSYASSQQVQSATFTATVSNYVIDFCRIGHNSTVYPALFSNVQLEQGTVATPYTPYAVQENKLPQKYVPKKNLINTNPVRWENGITVGGAVPNRIRSIDFIPVDTTKSYTVSCDFTKFCIAPVTFAGDMTTVITDPGWKTSPWTFTPSAGSKYVRITVRTIDSVNIDSSAVPSILPQLEEGSTATLFESYQLVLPPANKGLSFNGVTDYLQLPSMMMDTIEIECIFASGQMNSYLIDARNGLAYGYWYVSGAGVDSLGSGFTQMTVNGVTQTTIPKDQRVKVKLSANSSFTDNVTVFAYNDGSVKAKGILYKVTCYLNGNIVAQYDFTNPNNIVGNTVMQNAQNLIPSFEDVGWTINSNAKVLGKDTMHLDATGGSQVSSITLPVTPNTSYLATCHFGVDVGHRMYLYKPDGITALGGAVNPNNLTQIVTPTDNVVVLKLYNYPTVTGSFDFIRPQLYQLDGTEGTINGSPVQLNKPSKRSLYAKR